MDHSFTLLKKWANQLGIPLQQILLRHQVSGVHSSSEPLHWRLPRLFSPNCYTKTDDGSSSAALSIITASCSQLEQIYPSYYWSGCFVFIHLYLITKHLINLTQQFLTWIIINVLSVTTQDTSRRHGNYAKKTSLWRSDFFLVSASLHLHCC